MELSEHVQWIAVLRMSSHGSLQFQKPAPGNVRSLILSCHAWIDRRFMCVYVSNTPPSSSKMPDELEREKKDVLGRLSPVMYFSVLFGSGRLDGAEGVTSIIDGDTGWIWTWAPELDKGNVEFLRYPIRVLTNGHAVLSKLSPWNGLWKIFVAIWDQWATKD